MFKHKKAFQIVKQKLINTSTLKKNIAQT